MNNGNNLAIPEEYAEQEEDDHDDPDDPEVDGDDDANSDIPDTYNTILEDIVKMWIVVGLTHHISKSALNELWKLAAEKFPKLFAAKARENINRKTPQFKHLCKKFYQDLPKVNMELAYCNKETGAISVVKTESTPKAKFPADKFQKLYEIASVNVS